MPEIINISRATRMIEPGAELALEEWRHSSGSLLWELNRLFYERGFLAVALLILILTRRV